MGHLAVLKVKYSRFHPWMKASPSENVSEVLYVLLPREVWPVFFLQAVLEVDSLCGEGQYEIHVQLFKMSWASFPIAFG
jgi:hypothetical protein